MDVDVGHGFDRACLSFLLHNFHPPDRVRLLRRTDDTLAEGGRIGILDWALPVGRVRAAAWSWFLGRIEPSPTAKEMLTTGLDADICSAGLGIQHRQRAAGGRVELLIVSPDARERPDEGIGA